MLGAKCRRWWKVKSQPEESHPGPLAHHASALLIELLRSDILTDFHTPHTPRYLVTCRNKKKTIHRIIVYINKQKGQRFSFILIRIFYFPFWWKIHQYELKHQSITTILHIHCLFHLLSRVVQECIIWNDHGLKMFKNELQLCLKNRIHVHCMVWDLYQFVNKKNNKKKIINWTVRRFHFW